MHVPTKLHQISKTIHNAMEEAEFKKEKWKPLRMKLHRVQDQMIKIVNESFQVEKR